MPLVDQVIDVAALSVATGRGERTVERVIRLQREVLDAAFALDQVLAIAPGMVWANGNDDRFAQWVDANYEALSAGLAIPDTETQEDRHILDVEDIIRLVTDDVGLSEAVVEEVVLAYWNQVRERLNDGADLRLEPARPETAKSLQSWLAVHLDHLEPHGYSVRLHATTDDPSLGEEMTLPNGRRRADLVCRTEEDNWLIIELKVVPATPDAYEQVKDYMARVETFLASGRQVVEGLVISEGTTQQFRDLVSADDSVSYVLASTIEVPSR